MDFLKFHKKKVLISLVSASMVFLGLSYYYSMPERKKFHFHRRKNGKPSFSEKIREFFNPLLFFARRRREKHEIIAEIQTNKLAEIIKRSENEGKEFKEVVEIYDKTEENLEKIDFKALNFNAKFKGKKRKGKKKLCTG